MAIEQERKFLLISDEWRSLVVSSTSLNQAYVASTSEASVRVRVAGAEAWITVKSQRVGNKRHEWEYPVPVTDAEEMISTVGGHVVAKTRHLLSREPGTWTVDEFRDESEGLIVLEIEGTASDSVKLPAWVGREVTEDDRYSNVRLAVEPYSSW